MAGFSQIVLQADCSGVNRKHLPSWYRVKVSSILALSGTSLEAKRMK